MRKTRQTTLDEFGLRTQRDAIENTKISAKQPEETEEKPYWSVDEWENWALQIYRDQPEGRKYLPSWLLEAIEGK